jgi:serine/threonine-protein kinase
MPPSHRLPEPGNVVAGRYRIDVLRGRSSFGALFLGTARALGRAVALKVLTGDEMRGTPDALSRFRREAELYMRLEHPNLASPIDFGLVDGGIPFVVTERLEGVSLDEALRKAGPIPPGRVATIAAQLLRGFASLHAQGLVHANVKPANVFLARDVSGGEQARLLDVGVARMCSGDGRSKAPSAPAYLAPEQLRGLEGTPSCDLYALGLVLAEAISGRPVFGGDSASSRAEQASPAPVPLPMEAIASPLGAILLRATRKAPAERYPNAQRMLEDVEAQLGGAVSSARQRTMPPPRTSVAPGPSASTPPGQGIEAPQRKSLVSRPSFAGGPPSQPLRHSVTARPEELFAQTPSRPAPRPASGAVRVGPLGVIIARARALGDAERRMLAWTGAVLGLLLLLSGSAYALWPRPSETELVHDQGFHGVTSKEIRARIEAAGWKVSHEQRAQSPGSVVVTFDAARGIDQASVQFHRYDAETDARDLEETIRKAKGAARRDTGTVIVVMPGGSQAAALADELAR